MASGWTPERRARQAEQIKQWRPWDKSTGPRSEEGKGKVAQNAYKGGYWDTMRDLTRTLKEQKQLINSFLD